MQTKYGSWAIVTGASDGIGCAMAHELARAGLNLVLVARRRATLEHLASNLHQHYNIETRVIDADLSNPQSVQDVMAATHDLDLGLFVGCAGFGTSGRLIDSNLEQELNMIDVNCRAVLAMTQQFGQRFAQQKRGGIILMSSIVAFQGVPLAANYAATKAYIQSLAEGLHAEMAPLGVDVIASAPGPVHSGFAERAQMRLNQALQPETVARETLQALGRKTTVRPGILTKFLSGSLSMLPRSGRVRAMARVMKGMT